MLCNFRKSIAILAEVKKLLSPLKGGLGCEWVCGGEDEWRKDTEISSVNGKVTFLNWRQ